jgi:Secretion system C-terminal sorting domain/FG-GAP-like repeat
MIRLIFIFVFIATLAKAQFSYTIDQTIPVEANGTILAMPWAGGLNAAQINTMDLNGDNKQDLVIFERTTNQVLTYLNQNNQYVHAPSYESLFPAYINQWLLLRDFNCDGKKDLFTSDPFGLVAFVNTTKPGQPLSWRPFNIDKTSGTPFPILTQGFSGNINLKINIDDIPAIDDIDGDGDLDILNVYFVGNGVEWHKNLSKENSGNCDSLQFKRITQEWGNFLECNCAKFAFNGKTCAQIGGRAQHSGGKALLTMDINNDGAKELFFTEQSCANLYLLNNTGTRDNPIITSFTTFPASSPLLMPFYPVPFLEDVDFNGLPDLLVTPNLSFRNSRNNNFQQSLYLFKNGGSANNPQFTFSKNNFLQGDMIDVGDNSVPAFFDMDGDGDLDMLVSNNVRASQSATVAQYENTGTNQQPSFKLVTEDYFFLSTLNYSNIKIQFADVDADGKKDLAFTANTNLNSAAATLLYISNSAQDRFTVTDAQLKSTKFIIGTAENALLEDIDQNGLLDVLVGTETGAIEYWKNQGPAGSFNYVLDKPDFLGIGNSTDRQNLAMAVADFDGDGFSDLVTANQRGEITLYPDFRTQNNSNAPITKLIYNEVTKEYQGRNFGANCWPTAANLFNSDRPAIVIGNTRGGLYVLKNDGGQELPPEPVINLYPNPVTPANNETLKIVSDRNVQVQFYSLLGQRMGDVHFVLGNQNYTVDVRNLPAGMYIARFSWKGKTYGKKFVILN